MKKILILILLLVATPTYAANTSGYAWSESVGWFDFSNMTIGDTTVTGYAYNDNTGWLVLDGITNANGIFSGHAWSESVGYFDFSDVYVEEGSVKGYAYNDNTGWLSFETGTTVTTSWDPPVQSSSSNRRQKRQVVVQKPTTTPVVNTPTTIPVGELEVAALRITLASNPRDLEQNTEGEDVRLLQKFLNQQGFVVNTPGQVGSSGYETTFFGSLTQQALARFQQANGINPPAGYFGPITRAFISSLINNN